MSQTDAQSSKLVSMRFRPSTIESVNLLRKATGIDNRTQLTAKAIALARWWVEKAQSGARLYAEYPDGTRETVEVPGLTNPPTTDDEPDKEGAHA